jgi:hypothetical protein
VLHAVEWLYNDTNGGNMIFRLPPTGSLGGRVGWCALWVAVPHGRVTTRLAVEAR